MRVLPSTLKGRVESGDFTGESRATTRVTIQKIQLGLYNNGSQVYSSAIFPTVAEGAKELPNVKSMQITRGIDNEIATMSMELFNTKPLSPGEYPPTGDPFDLQGYYTYNRGRTSFSQSNWGHTANEWQDMVVPDRLVRVYQGYGADYGALPENDSNLVLMGIFIIDDVTYTADGLITVDARDLGRLLTDQIMFPPVVPLANYPLKFERVRLVDDAPTPRNTTVWQQPTLDTTSNGTAAQFGHVPADAYDGGTNGQPRVNADGTESYWLSEGFDVPNHPSSYVWTQGKLSGATVSAVRVAVRGGRYRVYLSVYTDKAQGGKITGWNGKVRVPYKKATTLPDNGSRITYSKTGIVEYGGTLDLTFPPVAGVTKVRLTFTNLYNSHNNPHPYRAAVRDIQVAVNEVELVVQGQHYEGNYSDYTDIVKLLLAYGGFYWPAYATQYLTGSNQQPYTMPVGTGEHYLAQGVTVNGQLGDPQAGRIWGDIKASGTSGPAALGIEVWDKKPLMDGINYIKEILGYLFFVDETGGAVFRPRNYYKLGNYKVDVNGYNTTRTNEYVEVTDENAIIGMRAKLSSRNLRERVFVADVAGKIGAVAAGRIPHPSNFRRVAGWTDQNFGTTIGTESVSEDEAITRCQVMADLITLRQLFTFRTNSIRIPANPAIQCDDQILVKERTTGDAYFHYVRGITSTWDLADGKWMYDLTTSWLGTDPTTEWAFSTTGLSDDTRAYLAALGQI